jgi:hypothetical protein
LVACSAASNLQQQPHHQQHNNSAKEDNEAFLSEEMRVLRVTTQMQLYNSLSLDQNATLLQMGACSSPDEVSKQGF